ncbi:hypothetical protein DFH28DRAFT_1158567, partial [Melampsora americana]
MSERAIPMQGIHTNNFTESYHRVLKYSFLSRHTLRRPDDTIQVLVDTAEPDFRQSLITTSLGFRQQRTTKYQNVAKGLADSYTDADLKDLGVTIQQRGNDKWSVSSFTRPFAITYHIKCTPPKDGRVGFINNCSCSHYSKSKSSCKHMYVLARQTSYKILETNSEIDDGHSAFVPRGITQPFNLVVRTMTSVHRDSPTPSPPPQPYRSSSGMVQTPSTTGLPGGTFQYAPMVPAPLPYRRPEQPPSLPPLRASPVTDSNWLSEATRITTGRTNPSSDSYIDRVFYDPHHLQSTPLPARSLPGFPSTPFVMFPAPRGITQRPVSFGFPPPHLPGGPLPPPTASHPHRHHPYLRQLPPPADGNYPVPGPPPPTQVVYQLDPQALHRHLQPYAVAAAPRPSAHAPLRVRTPEATPAPVTTSQLDGLFQEMEAGRDRPHLIPPTPRHPSSHIPTPHRRPTASTSSTINTTPGVYDGFPMTQTTNTHQSIDQGPSTLTELEVDAMNAAELEFYKKKDDLAELLKVLRQINAEAPFSDEACILNRLSSQLIAAMRHRAAEFLTTLRVFNSTNRPSKQRR